MKALAEDELDRDWLSDAHGQRLRELVQKKVEAGEDVVTEWEETEPEQQTAEVIDLMKVLKESLERTSTPAKGTALEKRSKSELYERAKELHIEGRSSMTKEELIDAIREAG